jgi:hypothetical protein
MKRVLILLLAAMIITLGTTLTGCDDDDTGNGSDGDADGDGDTDADGDGVPIPECTNTATWGNSFEPGGHVANWKFFGVFDSDGDGEVEMTGREFTLEDIFCLGFESLVILSDDKQNEWGPIWLEQAVKTPFLSALEYNKAAMLMSVSDELGKTARGYKDTYEYFNGFGFTPGFYIDGPPTAYEFEYFLFNAVINLKTGELADKTVGAEDYQLSSQEIVLAVEEIHESK